MLKNCMMVCYHRKMIVIRSVNLLSIMTMSCYQKIVMLVKLLVVEICKPKIIGRGVFSVSCVLSDYKFHVKLKTTELTWIIF